MLALALALLPALAQSFSSRSGGSVLSGSSADASFNPMMAATMALAPSGTAPLGGSASERESCFACRYLLRAAYDAAGGKEATGDELTAALTAICLAAPPVYMQGCATMLELKTHIADTLGFGRDFSEVCGDIQLCWEGLMNLSPPIA